MRKLVVLSALASLGWTAPGVAETTYAERLGWKAGDRVLIIHCDDAGMSLALNRGAIEALEFGLVTSVSAMMPMRRSVTSGVSAPPAEARRGRMVAPSSAAAPNP